MRTIPLRVPPPPLLRLRAVSIAITALTAFSALAVLLALSPASAAEAQERHFQEIDLPQDVAEEIVRFFNGGETLRLSGETSVPASRTLTGDVGVLGGPVRLAGMIDGTLVVVNGRLELEPGARITGDVMIVGGRVIGLEEAQIDGILAVYEERLRYVQRQGQLVYSGPRQPIGPSLESRFGRSHFTVRTGTNYNRVEGLPVMFGPLIETTGRNPLRFEGFGIWRSTSGLNLQGEELGYSVLLEQQLFARRDAGVGVALHSEVLPIERWGLSDAEASLSTFLLHRDYRDYYDARGWSGFVRSGIPNTPLQVLLEYREERHRFAQESDPWSITGGEAEWRPQPLVGEGDTRSIGAELVFDNRNETRLPSSGWLIRATGRFGVGGTLAMPGYSDTGDGPTLAIPERPLDNHYRTGFLDVRRYNRVSPTSRLSVRGLVGGSLGGSSLAPQFQHALGGEGSLPGHRRFFGDCGARAETGQIIATVRRGDRRGEEVPVVTHPAYGCDRVALFQAEYQGSFDLPRSWRSTSQRPAASDEWDWSPFLDLRPSWSVFFNAGRGWALPDPVGAVSPGIQREDTEVMMDLGAGVFMGAVGLYWAVPLDGGDRGVNFFVRLTQRF